MKAKIVFDFTDRERRAVAAHAGMEKASRADMIAWVHMTLRATMAELLTELGDEQADEEEMQEDEDE